MHVCYLSTSLTINQVLLLLLFSRFTSYKLQTSVIVFPYACLYFINIPFEPSLRFYDDGQETNIGK